MINWMKKTETMILLAKLEEKYFGYFGLFDYFDAVIFKKRLKTRLPKYLKEFNAAGVKLNIDPILLASISYQESQWNKRARSPTGVRGLMMLTLLTAADMGVTDRLDPKQSIQGGAKYFKHLRRRLPASILEPDRTWVSLAAYNVGFGHIMDARVLARRMRRNPDLWKDLKKILPLLSQKRYYKKLKYGYARGLEPVRYVQRIRNFYNILQGNLEGKINLPISIKKKNLLKSL